ncbi:50S ribosomal protein L33 [Candidatus Daviesbacteria bacterium RIFCSPHIGHO2_01_FULL_38_8]|nr:MAG: 50S ribosomal protein L33 [Candidatus Daviesbacteria bacterium RIFCSPHIGHO2_01_FULL_38_8]
MAKKENRQLFGLECSICHSHNYVTTRNVINTKAKLELNKFCKRCRKATSHSEFKKLD